MRGPASRSPEWRSRRCRSQRRACRRSPGEGARRRARCEKAKSQLKDTIKEATPDSPASCSAETVQEPVRRWRRRLRGDDQSGRAAPGFGSGRRMPVQQAVDVAVPVTAPTTTGPSSRTGPSSCTGSRAPSRSTTHRLLPGEDLGDQQAVRGRHRRAAARRADRVERHRGLRSHRRRHLSRAVGEPDPDRPLARRPAVEHDRQGEPRDALRQARRPRRSAPLQGLRRARHGRGRTAARKTIEDGGSSQRGRARRRAAMDLDPRTGRRPKPARSRHQPRRRGAVPSARSHE